MRISLFHPSFRTVGGAELLVVGQARMLRALGVDVRIVTLDWDPGRWADRLGDLPVQVVTRRHWSDALFGFTRMRKLRRRSRRACRPMRDSECVLAYNYPTNSMLGAACLPGRRVWQCNEPNRSLHMRQGNPVLTARVESGVQGPELATGHYRTHLEAHDANMRHRKTTIARYRFDLAAVRQLDQVFAISQFSRDNAREIYGICDEQVVYPVVRFPEGGRARRGLDRGGMKVLVHSRLEVVKNVDTVLRGVCAFRAAHDPSAEVHVVGDGPYREELERVTVELGLQDAVHFHGYLPEAELDEVCQACDVFALLPLDEPFGMVFPEAAARGLLLVGSDHGGPREILDDGRLGWCVDAFSPEALAEALAEIRSLGDDEVEARRAEADRACRSRYSAETIGPRLLKVLGGA